jgi:hypothetical protein
MTAEMIRDLLEPLVGQPGSIYLVLSRIGQIGFTATENNKLTAVEVRPDGTIKLERDAGWTVIDPAEVVAVGWNDDTERSAGLFL